MSGMASFSSEKAHITSVIFIHFPVRRHTLHLMSFLLSVLL